MREPAGRVLGRVGLVTGAADAAAAGSDHAFAAKFRLYASGRWLVIAAEQCFLF